MIVLDTHVWVWLVSGARALPPRAQAAIDGADRIGVCTISAWEISTLTRLGKLQLDRPVAQWVAMALAPPRIDTLALGTVAAVNAGLLPTAEFPGDPADRVIYATARERGAPLVTKDRLIRAYDPRGTIWD